jgi:hypothetical protein
MAAADAPGGALALGSDFSSTTDDPTSQALFQSDQFRMASMKVLPCSKRFVHDWTECPFAHPQEKARRRDPSIHNYTGIACPSMKKEGCCAFGDHCPYAHNVFEYWLHPTRYRTQLCNDGSNCKRKICFFAHRSVLGAWQPREGSGGRRYCPLVLRRRPLPTPALNLPTPPAHQNPPPLQSG